MPDRYLDKFKSNNERKCSKFKETRQNALYLFEKTVSGVGGSGLKTTSARYFKSEWFLKNYTKKCVQKLKKKKI